MDLTGIGQVDLSWDFDSSEYMDWLSEEGLSDSRESLIRYIEENVCIEIEYFDNETYHHCGYDTCSLSELKECVGEDMFSKLLNDLLDDGSVSFETSDVHNSVEFDVNNPYELNQVAMKILNHGEYYKGCRGFILTNGVVVYTPQEHNEVSQINGIGGTYDFLRKGNIRLLDRSIDIALLPTKEQREVLRRVISSYSDGELYLDLYYRNGGSFGVQYDKADWRYVMGEIDRWFSEGIKPQGRMFENTNNKKMKKTVKLTESALREVIKKVLNEMSDLSVADARNVSDSNMRAYTMVKKRFDALDNEFKDVVGEYRLGYTHNSEIDSIYAEFTKVKDRFYTFYTRKLSQNGNFEDEYQQRGKPEGREFQYPIDIR